MRVRVQILREGIEQIRTVLRGHLELEVILCICMYVCLYLKFEFCLGFSPFFEISRAATNKVMDC